MGTGVVLICLTCPIPMWNLSSESQQSPTSHWHQLAPCYNSHSHHTPWLWPTSHAHGPCPTWMTSIPNIILTCYSKVLCIMLSSDLSYTLNLALIPMYTLHLHLSIFPSPLHPSHLCFPWPFASFTSPLSSTLHALTSPFSPAHGHVPSVNKSLSSCMFLHLKYQIRLLSIVCTAPLHNPKHPIKLQTLNLLQNPSFYP